MTDSTQPIVLAIDGGGTRCRIAVETDAGVTSVEAGSANVSTDFDGGVHQIIEGLSTLSAAAGLALSAIKDAPAFIGLAGVTGPEIAGRLSSALPLNHTRIADDQPAALRGALGARDGVIAHCGTGSFYGAQIAGSMTFAGGWGPTLGDEASAQWIGRAALRVTLETVDGRVDASALSARLMERFGGATGIVRFGGSAQPAEFGALAPLVTSHAADGDSLAVQIMTEGAREIGRSLPQIGWRPGLVICLTGGIGPHFEPYLPEEMRDAIVAPAGEPLSGALSLARDFAEGIDS